MFTTRSLVMIAVGSFFLMLGSTLLWLSNRPEVPSSFTPFYLRDAGEGEAEEGTRTAMKCLGALLCVMGTLQCLGALP